MQIQRAEKPRAVHVGKVAYMASGHYAAIAEHADLTGNAFIKEHLCRKGIETYHAATDAPRTSNNNADWSTCLLERSMLYKELAGIYGIAGFKGLENRYAGLSRSLELTAASKPFKEVVRL